MQIIGLYPIFCYNNIGDMMIKSDSRRIKKGDIFIALPGVRSDGHDYIIDAISRGASKVIAIHGSYSVDTLIVSDTRKYLKKYLVSNYKEMIDDMVIIGVTGTNGKTTVSNLIYDSLNMLGKKCSMIGTLGYFKDKKVCSLSNTCPDLALMYELLIDSYESGYKYVVLEASSQGLVEDRLYGISFDFSIFTNLTHDHLDYHKTFKNYVLAKQKLFKQLKSNGFGIVNVDDKYKDYFSCNNLILYGFNDCDYKILDYMDNEFSFFHDYKYVVKHNLIGKYNVYNLMCCIVVLNKLGFDMSLVLSVISKLSGPKGRMEVYSFNTNRIIVDYAHTPDAIKNVLSSVKNYNKLYVVFGCTGNRDKSKRPIMTQMLLDNCDHVIITSDDLYYEDFNDIVSDMLNGVSGNNYSICYDRGDAIIKGISYLDSDDILLVLGKGHEEFMKVGSNLIPFNDGKFIKEFINKSI